MLGRVGAERLGAVDRVLWSYQHGNCVVDGQDNQRQHDCCEEQALWRGVAFANFEDGDPEEADANGSNASDG